MIKPLLISLQRIQTKGATSKNLIIVLISAMENHVRHLSSFDMAIKLMCFETNDVSIV